MKKFLSIYFFCFYAFCMDRKINVNCHESIGIKFATKQNCDMGSGGWALSKVEPGSLLSFPDEIKDHVLLTISTKDSYYLYVIEDLNFQKIVICCPNELEMYANNGMKKISGCKIPNRNAWKPIEPRAYTT